MDMGENDLGIGSGEPACQSDGIAPMCLGIDSDNNFLEHDRLFSPSEWDGGNGPLARRLPFKLGRNRPRGIRVGARPLSGVTRT
jgi:hypothetical protein